MKRARSIRAQSGESGARAGLRVQHMRIASTRRRRKEKKKRVDNTSDRLVASELAESMTQILENGLITCICSSRSDSDPTALAYGLYAYFFRLFLDRLGRRVERNVSQLICAIKRRIYASACTLLPSKLIFMAPVLCVNSINFALNSINRNGGMEIYRADTEHVVLSREAERELS